MKKNRIFMLGFGCLVTILLSVYIYNSSSDPIVLEFGDFAGSNWDIPNWSSSKITDEAITRFEAIHPRIQIKYLTGIPKSDYSEWLAQKTIMGKEPDVFCVLESDFNTLASIGILKKLDGLIKNDSEFQMAKFYTNAVKSGQFSGSQYALAREVVPVLMFVNKTLLTKEGMVIPRGDWTWDDFYRICQRVTKDTDGDGKIDQFGTVGFDWHHAVYTNGQQLFDPYGTKAMFDQPGVVEAIQYIQKLNRLNANIRVTPDDYDNGKVAFRPFPFSAYRAYKSYPYRLIRYAQFEWECIKLPRGPRGKNASELHSFLIGISARTKHQREAWEFLKFLTYDWEMQMNVYKYSYGVPVLHEVTESTEADMVLSKYTPDQEISVDKRLLGQVIEQSTVTPRFHKYGAAMSIADNEIFRIINDAMDAETSLRNFNRYLNEYLKQ